MLSVIIPTRNRYSNLINTVNNLLEQDLNKDEWELIISDDNSTDETFNIYKNNRDKLRLKYVNNNTKPHSWNASIPRNLGALVADPNTSAYIFLDSDVLISSTALSFFKEDFDHNPRRVVVGSYDFMEKNGVDIQVQDVRHLKFETVKPEDTFDTIHDGLACFGGLIMIPRDIFWSVGGFSPDIHIGLEDGDMGIKLWKKETQFSYDNRIHGKHQWHETPTDRFPPDMKSYIDDFNMKHFKTKNPDYGIIEASRETYAEWGIFGWEPPKEWLANKLDLTMKINK